MNANAILQIATAVCHGQRKSIPAMKPADLARLLNDMAWMREEIHGPACPAAR